MFNCRVLYPGHPPWLSAQITDRHIKNWLAEEELSGAQSGDRFMGIRFLFSLGSPAAELISRL